MPGTCYLHIGTPKTGSTSLQAWCAHNKDELARRGILYPGSQKRHNALVSEVFDAPEKLRFNKTGIDYSDAATRRDTLAADFAEVRASRAVRTLYSNEVFVLHARKLDLDRLRNTLAAHHDAIRVLAFVRDPYKQLISRAQEIIKSGVRTYEQVCDRPPLMNVAEALQLYREAFGAEALVLRSFDETVAEPRGLTGGFLDMIQPGIDLNGFENISVMNPSLSLEAALILSGLNRDHSFSRDWAGRYLRPEMVAGIGQTKFDLPADSVLMRRDALLVQYDALARMGLHFTPPDWDALRDPQPDWGPDTMARIATSMNALARSATTATGRRPQGGKNGKPGGAKGKKSGGRGKRPSTG